MLTRPALDSTWLTVSLRGGQKFDFERPIAPVFDHLQAPDAGGLFIGDYQGLAASDQPGNRTDVQYGQFPSIEPDRTVASSAQPVPVSLVRWRTWVADRRSPSRYASWKASAPRARTSRRRSR